ncbi:MAG TPA: cellulase family glycosylhydrolase [Stellaceae bacterium]|nr:cellulase family glycosylhydrolase [Stellaceae bacterium]
MRKAIAILACLAVLFCAAGPARSGSPPLAISVAGNRLVDRQGNPVRLLGVNRSGTEFMCVGTFTSVFDNRLHPVDVSDTGGRFGIFDGPVDRASIRALKGWHANAVRISLNEDCWLGINGVSALTIPTTFSRCNNPQTLAAERPSANRQNVGENYRKAIIRFVKLLNRYGIYAIVDLHWNAPARFISCQQQPMADKDHAIDFWRSVAGALRNDPAVIFDMYNEPHLNSLPRECRGDGECVDDRDPWHCWYYGCRIRTQLGTDAKGNPVIRWWRTAGMRDLVEAVRAAGARQPIMLGGLSWAADLSQWQRYARRLPDAQLAAGFHSYCGQDSTDPAEAACRGTGPAQLDGASSPERRWSTIAALALHVPVVAGEFGEFDCRTTYTEPFMKWADRQGISYLGWAWKVAGGRQLCGVFPALLAAGSNDAFPFDASYYAARPNAYGAGLKRHLEALRPGP